MSRQRFSRICSIATVLPETVRTTRRTQDLLQEHNAGMRLPTGLIERITGVRRVHVADEGVMASDLAVAAAEHLLAEAEFAPTEVDLLLFASATQDLIEPATAHIVAAKLGLCCPVFDVKNACNSVLNAIETADALIRVGGYERVLVCSGEKPSVATRWRLEAPEDFLRAFPGYTMCDAGAAVLLEATQDPHGPRVLGSGMLARSRHWSVGTVASGGTVDPDASFGRWFDMDGRALTAAFREIPAQPWAQLVARSGTSVERARVVAVHQVAAGNFEMVRETLGVRAEQFVDTIREHGNMASVSLPRQLELARRSGLLRDGDESLLVGLAGGISVGAIGVRW